MIFPSYKGILKKSKVVHIPELLGFRNNIVLQNGPFAEQSKNILPHLIIANLIEVVLCYKSRPFLNTQLFTP